MKTRELIAGVLVTSLVTIAPSAALADPCGMVPPVWEGQGPAIKRVGLQKTYVFFDKGVETFVIRPGFTGKVDNFGMLIPFPSVPSIRKVPDETFAHLDAAIDPPEVTIDLRPRRKYRRRSKRPSMAKKKSKPRQEEGLKFDEVRVLKQEAVGMYEIAVLEAGSPKALNRWMEDHGFKYPKGMDDAVLDYVNDRWCFVAVKTRVGAKKNVNPRPGMRKADPKLPSGAKFDGHVQAMGFRFKVKKPVVPMRLSTFNEGELRNLVYIVARDPMKIRDLPGAIVRRQIRGPKLHRNVTDLLPIRILGGPMSKVPKQRIDILKSQRDPTRHNGVARDLFASDMLAAATGELAHDFEEREKKLLNVSERLNLRGAEIDRLHQSELEKERKATLKRHHRRVRAMTLTLVDGDFPRDYLAKNNLRFQRWQIPSKRNTRDAYHARQHNLGLFRGQTSGVYVDRAIARWASQENDSLGYWNEVWDAD
jgi:hypothetical protein